MNRRIACAYALVAIVFALEALNASGMSDRIVPAYQQCAAPTFSHSVACFVNDVVTGEDL